MRIRMAINRIGNQQGRGSLRAVSCQWAARYLPAIAAILVVGGCASKPLMPYTTDTTPLLLAPAIVRDNQDKRGRFREVFCAVLEARKDSVPDYRSCNEALTTVGKEPSGTGNQVNLGESQHPRLALFVGGVGWDCFSEWLELQNTVQKHISQFGFDASMLSVDSLASSSNNSRQIRDAILATPRESGLPDLILIGYSKGTTDILEAVVSYPEIHERIAAVVSIAGSVGGSPLANDASQSQLNLLQHFPGATCKPGDEGALDSMRPSMRKAWLAENPLPEQIPYYSLITFPDPAEISSLLRSFYKKLGKVDARNDGQVIFYDQFIPGSTLVAYLNADHWAPAVPIARAHGIVGRLFVDENDYPREALLEALLRFLEEDLQRTAN
jgi:hypothetical protein